MSDRTKHQQTAGLVLIGTHAWTNSAFDRLMPRAMLPVAHRPLFSYALSWLKDAGIREAAVCGNRETSGLRTQLERQAPAGMNVSYHEDPMPRGAAGSLRDAAVASTATRFVVTDGTAIPNTVNLQELLDSHEASGAAVTVVVDLEPGKNGGPVLQVPSGIYVFERRALEQVPTTGFYDIKEKLLPLLYRNGERVVTYSNPCATPRVFGTSTFLAVNEWMVEQLVNSDVQPEGYIRIANGLVHRDAYIAPDATLVGPVVVAPGARVLSGAMIVGPSSIGCDVTVEAGALVSRSAVWRRSSVGEQSIADRCIVTDDAIVEAHTHATQAVMVQTRPRQVEPRVVAPERSIDAFELPVMEFGRKVARLLIGADWSRTPAAQ